MQSLPRPVPLVLGGTPVVVSQFTLGDLADIDAWLATQGPSLFGQRPDDPTERRAALRAAYDLAERGGICLGSSEADRLLSTHAGAALLLWLGCRKADLSTLDAKDLAPRLTADDWRSFDRVVWATDPVDEITAEIDREIGVRLPRDESGDRLTWDQAVAAIVKRLHCTFEEAERVTVGQLEILFRDGKKKEHTFECPAGWSRERWEKECQEPRAAFWSEDGGTSPMTQPATTETPTAPPVPDSNDPVDDLESPPEFYPGGQNA